MMKDKSLQQSSSFISGIATAVFWLIFLICSIFIKPQPKKPKYKEIQIVLSSTPVVKKESEAPAPAQAAPTTPAPVKQEKAETAQKTVKEPAKTEVKKTAPAAEKKVTTPTEYAVDPMEAFNQQVSKAPKKEFDWSQFDDEPAETSDSPTSNKFVNPVENSFFGSAGTAAPTNTNIRQTSSSNEDKTEEKVSDRTTDQLGKIENSTFKGNAVGGVQSEVEMKANVSGSGKTMMEMTDGTQRALLEPSEPIINLSEKAAATIDGSKTVTITFKVVESGNVPRGDISITPASTLTEIVRNEIYDQISKWRFESASFVSTAKFEYKIIKK